MLPGQSTSSGGNAPAASLDRENIGWALFAACREGQAQLPQLREQAGLVLLIAADETELCRIDSRQTAQLAQACGQALVEQAATGLPAFAALRHHWDKIFE